MSPKSETASKLEIDDVERRMRNFLVAQKTKSGPIGSALKEVENSRKNEYPG